MIVASMARFVASPDFVSPPAPRLRGRIGPLFSGWKRLVPAFRFRPVASPRSRPFSCAV